MIVIQAFYSCLSRGGQPQRHSSELSGAKLIRVYYHDSKTKG